MNTKNNLSYEELISLNSHLLEENEAMRKELEVQNSSLAEISHKLRTPLNAILGFTSIAQTSGNETQIIMDCLDKINFSAYILLNTANRIIELDAAKKGNLGVYNSCFNLKLLISSISKVCSDKCRNGNILYKVSLDGVTEDSVMGDAAHLRKMLMILLTRAVEVTDNGGNVDFEITQKEINKDIVQIQFKISDSGCVMSSSELEQYMNWTKNSEIFLVKKLCELMNGVCTFENRSGLGSVFTITIPFGIDKKTEVVTCDILSGYRILLISKDEQMIANVSSAIDQIGAECIAVPDSEAGLKKIRDDAIENKEFNLCFIDWGESPKTGIKNTAEIRREGTGSLKIVAVADSNYQDVKHAAKTAGADKVLFKPLVQSIVFSLMMELTGREYTKLIANPDNFDFSGCKVLLAEDNDLSATITITQLESVGIYTDRADNGTDCVDILRSAKTNYYDLIILDMRMPYMDGCETASAIRNLNVFGCDKIPIIALTADALKNDIDAAFKAGINDYIIKPIDSFQLYSTIGKYISNKQI